MCGNKKNSRKASKHLVKTLQISTCTQLRVPDGRHLVNEADIAAAALTITTRPQNKVPPFLTTVKLPERNHHFAAFFSFFFFFFFLHSEFTVDGLTQGLNHLKSHWNYLRMRTTPEALSPLLCWFSLDSEVRFFVVLRGEKQEQQKFNDKYQPGVYRTCQLILFGTKTRQRLYVTPCRSYLHPFFFFS